MHYNSSMRSGKESEYGSVWILLQKTYVESASTYARRHAMIDCYFL